MAGIVGWSVILAVALAWEGLALRAPDDRWLTLSDILRFATRPALGRWLLFALWLWLGWHVFVRGWDFFLQEPPPRPDPGGDRPRPGAGSGLAQALVPLVGTYVALLGLLAHCALALRRSAAARCGRRGGGARALVRHVASLAGAGYVVFLAGLLAFDAGWGRDPTLLPDALAGGALLAAVAAVAFVALALGERAARRRA